MTTSTETKPSANTPSFIVHQVIERENKKTVYIPIGATFAHQKGGGHTLDLNALPLKGRIVLFVPSAKPE